jgi:hypothetical protein
VKIDEKNRLSSDKIMKKLLINFHTRFRESLGGGVGAERVLRITNRKESGDCSDIGNDERQKILDPAEHHHWTL